jgi:hypothetical protein
MSAMAGMLHAQLGETMTMVHTAEKPTDVEWDAMLAHFRAKRAERVIVFTDGGGPSTLQRGRLNDALEGSVVKTAIVSSSQVIRGIVTALSWFNPGIRSFSPHQASLAMSYLGLPATEHERLMQHVLKLSRELQASGLRCVVWPGSSGSDSTAR